jgi:mono/diheme cytochrome c family protein
MMRRAALLLVALAAACGDHDHQPLPCDVDAVMVAVCHLCHGDPPDFGAPMPLVVWEDTQARAPTDRSRLVWELMEERVHDPVRPMPPVGTGELDADELAILDAWFAAGAPPGEAECTPARER